MNICFAFLHTNLAVSPPVIRWSIGMCLNTIAAVSNFICWKFQRDLLTLLSPLSPSKPPLLSILPFMFPSLPNILLPLLFYFTVRSLLLLLCRGKTDGEAINQEKWSGVEEQCGGVSAWGALSPLTPTGTSGCNIPSTALSLLFIRLFVLVS